MKQAIFCVDLQPYFFLLLFHTEKCQCGTMGPGGTTLLSSTEQPHQGHTIAPTLTFFHIVISIL